MATQNLGEFKLLTAEEIHSNILNDIKASYRKRGKEINVSEGSAYYLDNIGLANQIEGATQFFQIKADAQMADTAVGEDLYRITKILGLGLRPSGPSTGKLIVSSSVDVPVAIVQGATLSDDTGLKYEVSIGGNFSDGDLLDIDSVDTGTATNLPEGTVLRWASPPAFINPTAEVATGGLIGGIDTETDEGLRTRYFEKLRNPQNGSNWSFYTDSAEKASTSVQKAFAYPAANGPATLHLAVAGNPTDTNKTREISSTIVDGTIYPFVYSLMAEFAELVVTSVVDYPVSVSLGLSLPDPPTASIPGPGGGWVDPIPFPDYSSVDGFSAVTTVTSTTVFIVKSNNAPIAGTSRVVWISKDDWKVRKATVLSYTGTTPNFRITIDTPFVSNNGISIASGDWVFPECENIDLYVSALFDVFKNFGPGQKTNSPGLLPRAYRRPLASKTWNSDLGKSIYKFITKTDPDTINSIEFLYTSDTSPPVPSLITDGPYILTPFNIGFYPV